ncbi:heat shock factor protein-like isoform X2 [Glandiceps talaboti]
MESSSGSAVPAFLTKLLALIEDPKTDDLIRWSRNGTSFIVGDQGRFSKEVLPKYFKHSNIASFIRQLNMYGFRKLVGIETGGLKSEKDETEFYHTYFVRGQPELLEQIKRKVSAGKGDEFKVKQGDVTRVLTEVNHLKGRQESVDNDIHTMKRENESLWREVHELRQKHVKQQQIVNKLIQFLLSLVQPSRAGLKRKLPLMIGDSSESLGSKAAKFGQHHLSIQPTAGAHGDVTSYDVTTMIEELLVPKSSQPTRGTKLQPSTSGMDFLSSLQSSSSGPIISEVTDPLSPEGAQTSKEAASSLDFSQLADTVPEEAVEPLKEIFEKTFSTEVPQEDLIGVLPDNILGTIGDITGSSSETLPLSEAAASNAASLETLIGEETLENSKALPENESQQMQVARPQGLTRSLSRHELTDHLDSMQTNLEKLQDWLTVGNLTVDASTLQDLFSQSEEEHQTSADNVSILHTLTDDNIGATITPSGHIVGNEVMAYSSPPSTAGFLADLGIPSFTNFSDDLNPLFDTDEPEEKTDSVTTTS